jgi:D-amino peptidase
MRLYISADIEGIAGVVTRDQGGPGAFEYHEARQWMTGEVNAACEAAFESGASAIVVCDSHGNGQNILPDCLMDKVELVRAWPRPLGMMQGIESGKYDGALLIGYHASSTNPGGVLAHTISSKAVREVRLNGAVVSEAELSAAMAAHYSVPVVFASGDDVCVREIVDAMPSVETVTTKRAYGTLSAMTLTPQESRNRIREGVGKALARIDTFACAAGTEPVSLSVSFKNRLPAELLAYLPIVSRRDAFTVQVEAADITQASAILMFMMHYGPV